MKLRYQKEKPFVITQPIYLRVEKGVTYETADKELQKQLIELGFHEVKPAKKKEGEE